MKKIVKNAIATAVVSYVGLTVIQSENYIKELRKSFPELTRKEFWAAYARYQKYAFEQGRQQGHIPHTSAELDAQMRLFLYEAQYTK